MTVTTYSEPSPLDIAKEDVQSQRQVTEGRGKY